MIRLYGVEVADLDYETVERLAQIIEGLTDAVHTPTSIARQLAVGIAVRELARLRTLVATAELEKEAASHLCSPGDRVVARDWYGGVPRWLVGEHGIILGTHFGRGKARRRLFADVQFDCETRTRTVLVTSLRFDPGIVVLEP